MKIAQDMIRQGMAFRCDSKEKVMEFKEKINKLGYELGSEDYLDGNEYISFKELTWYCPHEESCNSIDNYKDSCTIIEYVLDKDDDANNKFTMDDVKDGYLIETRNKEKYLCYNNINDIKVFKGDSWSVIPSDWYNYNFDMILECGQYDYDIVAVYGRSKFDCDLNTLDNTPEHRDLLWERKEN